MHEIDVHIMEGFRIGQVEDPEAATGLTAVLFPQGAAAGLDVRGGGPASRDTRILDSLAAAEFVHAIVLAGGSTFGLDATAGVQRYLEERQIGLQFVDSYIPLVCQSDIFDLQVGSSEVRPTADMGYKACVASEQGDKGNYRDGNYGAGCGATVGKVAGPTRSMKTGIGSFAVQCGALQVGAIVVVNALGDVYDPQTGRIIAGTLLEDGTGFADSSRLMYEGYAASTPHDVVANTTIGIVLTNAQLSKAQLCKVAGMGHDGMARAIRPVHTSMDGDSLYAVSLGDVPAAPDVVGTLAADVVAQAIVHAARSACGAHDLPAVADLTF